MGSRSLGKNIQNQARAIQYPALQFLLQIPLLAWAERMIEHHNLSTLLVHLHFDVRKLSASHKGAGMRNITGTHYVGHRVTACRQDKLLKLTRVFALRLTAKLQVDKDSALSGIGTIKEQGYLVKPESAGDGDPLDI